MSDTLIRTSTTVEVAPGTEWQQFEGAGGRLTVPTSSDLFDQHSDLSEVLAGSLEPEVLLFDTIGLGEGSEASVYSFGAPNLDQAIKLPHHGSYHTALAYLRYGGVCLQQALERNTEKWQEGIGASVRTPNYLGMIECGEVVGVVMSKESSKHLGTSGVHDMARFVASTQQYCMRALARSGMRLGESRQLRSVLPRPHLVNDINDGNILVKLDDPSLPLVIIDACHTPPLGKMW